MSDPYKPKGVRRPRPEIVRRAPRNPPVLRMRRVGITPEEEREALRTWATWTDAEKFEFLDAWDNLRDSEIRAMLAEGRSEAPYVSWDGVPDGTVDDVLDWVGDDADKATMALGAELARPKPRKTVVAALEALTG